MDRVDILRRPSTGEIFYRHNGGMWRGATDRVRTILHPVLDLLEDGGIYKDIGLENYSITGEELASILGGVTSCDKG